MNVFSYTMLRALLSTGGIGFQTIALFMLDSELVGQINKIQINAIFLGMILLPGIEICILRTSQKSIASENAFTVFCLLMCLVLTLIVLTGTLVKAVTNGHIETITTTVQLAFLFIAMRIASTWLRSIGHTGASLVFEQGIFFHISLILIFSNMDLTNAARFCTLGLVGVALFQIFFLFYKIKLATTEFNSLKTGANQLLSKCKNIWHEYSVTIALIPILNAVSLFGISSVYSIDRTPDQVASLMFWLRLIGLILLVETISVSYYLPKYLRIENKTHKTLLLNKLKFSLIAGTVITSLTSLILLTYIDEHLNIQVSYDSVVVYIFFILIQISNAVLCSPFALISTLGTKNEIKGIVIKTAILCGFAIVVAHNATSWHYVIVCFSIIQLARTLLSQDTLKKHHIK